MYWIVISGRVPALDYVKYFWENQIEKMERIIYMVSAPKRGCSALFFFVFSRQIHWFIVYYMFHFHAKVKHYTFILFVQVDYLQVLAICNHYKFVFFLCVLFPFFCPDIRQLLMCARVYVRAYRFVTLRATRAHTRVEVVNVLIYSILYKRKEIHVYTLLIISYL